MDDGTWPPEQLLSRLSYRARHIVEEMITVSEPAKRSSIRRQAHSSIGSLDRLPLEILHLSLNLLDFQSLFFFSRTSLLGKGIVESLPSYRDLMQYAPHAMKALGQAGLLHVHPATPIYQTMQSEACISCGGYGPFLFLITCHRCCYECLRQKCDLWVIPVSLAQKCFRLTSISLKQAPVLHSVPRNYSTNRKSRRRRLRLINVKRAKELAIKLHGSMENIDSSNASPRHMTEKELERFYLFRWVPEACT